MQRCETPVHMCHCVSVIAVVGITTCLLFNLCVHLLCDNIVVSHLVSGVLYIFNPYATHYITDSHTFDYFFVFDLHDSKSKLYLCDCVCFSTISFVTTATHMLHMH